MVKVWIADITPLLIEETYLRYYENVPVWRKEKAERLRMKDDKVRSVGAWVLWEKVREKEDLFEEVVFNLSHSGNYVLCAYSDKPEVQVGCDVEVIREKRLPVAHRFFCEREYQYIVEKSDEAEQTELFYRFWVLKESFMKATRRGMALDMRTYEFAWNREGVPELIRKPSEYPETFYFREYHEEWINARIAVCTTDPEIDSELHILKL